MLRLRRSRRIALVLIGTAALPACAPDSQRIVHDNYASAEDCAADWGRPEVCDRQDPAAHGVGTYGGRGFIFRGPDYPADDRQGAQYQAREQARALGRLDPVSGFGNRAFEAGVPSRIGGFGASAHFFGGRG